MPDQADHTPDSRPRSAGRMSHTRRCGERPLDGDERPTEPSPAPPHAEEEEGQGPPSTKPMGAARPLAEPVLVRVGDVTGESPPESRATLMPPPASRSTLITLSPPTGAAPPNPVDGLWLLSLRSLWRKLLAGEASVDRSEASVAAQVAACKVLGIVVDKLVTFGGGVAAGERWTIVAREIGRDGAKVTLEIAIEPADDPRDEAG